MPPGHEALSTQLGERQCLFLAVTMQLCNLGLMEPRTEVLGRKHKGPSHQLTSQHQQEF